MKRYIAIMFIIIMTLAIPTTIYGATTYKVSLASIDQIVKYSSTLANESRIKISKQYSSYLKASGEVLAAQNKLQAIDKKKKPDEYKAAEEEVKSLAEAASSEYNAWQSMILDESESMQTSSIAAKNEYLKYLKAVKTKALYYESIEKQKKVYKTAEEKFNRGLIARNALDLENEKLEDLIDGIEDAESVFQTQHEAIISALGIKSDDIIEVTPLSTEAQDAYKYALAINFDNDLKQAVSNSIELRRMQYSKTDYAAFTKAKEKVTKTFKGKYKAVTEQIKKINKNDKKIARANKKYKVAKLKYKKGYLSKNSFLEAKDAYNQTITDKNDSIEEIISVVLEYQSGMKGF